MDIDLRRVMADADRLGFSEQDLPGVEQMAADLLGDADQSAELADRAELLRAGIGRFAVDGPDPWAELPDGPDDGMLPMLALLVTAPDVVAYQLGRGVPEAQAWRNLSDLGQQVRVHRLAYGRFGLHNQGWLRTVWAGGFAWLGRLQFNVQPLPGGEWVLSTHIPRRDSDGARRSGALSPDAVDDSFEQAARFYAAYFPDLPATHFWCHSWLLAPELAAALPGSNMAAFSSAGHSTTKPNRVTTTPSTSPSRSVRPISCGDYPGRPVSSGRWCPGWSRASTGRFGADGFPGHLLRAVAERPQPLCSEPTSRSATARWSRRRPWSPAMCPLGRSWSVRRRGSSVGFRVWPSSGRGIADHRWSSLSRPFWQRVSTSSTGETPHHQRFLVEAGCADQSSWP